MSKLDEALLEDYARNFYGYGSYAAPFWFIGVGEGGGDTFAEVCSHHEAWRKLGRHQIDDLQESDSAYNEIKQKILKLPNRPVSPWFGHSAKMQKTWGGLIRILLRYIMVHGDAPADPIEDAQVIDHQTTLWARKFGISCILEVSPLASPSTNRSDWHYSEWTTISTSPQFASPIACLSHYGPDRAKNIRAMLLAQNPRPKVVVMYALTRNYCPFWEAIAGGRFEAAPGIQDLFIKQDDYTVFAVTVHPAYQFYKYTRGEDIGFYLNRIGTEFARLNPYHSLWS